MLPLAYWLSSDKTYTLTQTENMSSYGSLEPIQMFLVLCFQVNHFYHKTGKNKH